MADVFAIGLELLHTWVSLLGLFSVQCQFRSNHTLFLCRFLWRQFGFVYEMVGQQSVLSACFRWPT